MAYSGDTTGLWWGARAFAVTWLGVASGCSTMGLAPDPDPPGPPDPPDPSIIAVITETFESPRSPADNIDSPAVWHGPNGEHWLLVTAKEGHRILVFDAATGGVIRFVGLQGTGAGQFRRPNGIAVVDDLAMVVERDNERVHVLRLPEMATIGTFGDEILDTPYGIAIVTAGDGYDVYITDNYTAGSDDDLAERVRQFRVRVTGNSLSADLVRSFGDVSGPGRLRKVETIAADDATNLLLIAEEEPPSTLKVYTLEGVFTGTVLDPIYFPTEAEGIALFACEDGTGYWIATDQHDDDNVFRVFNRTDLSYLGAFSGSFVRNTDGVALTRVPFGPFPDGAFYAIHDDASIGAFSWRAIADALGLRRDC